MKKYKVIALSCTGSNGKIHHSGEELTADQLGGEKRTMELVKQGFLEAPKEESVKEAKATNKSSK